MLCQAPFLGVTVDPSGWIQLCCATLNRTYFKTKITDIDDLNEFFLGDPYNDIRKQMENDGLGSIPQCKNCWGSLNGIWTEADNYNRKSFSEPLKIRYLEFTTSNTCNQTCVTCSSYFSTKWRNLESKFNRNVFPSFFLDEKSIKKILKVLPDLKYLQIKGGEPFADKNNLKILKRLAEVNPECELIITSNFQNIPEEWYDTLSKLKNIKVGASVDGIGKNYDWIRGGSFEKTIRNIQKFYELTQTPVVINTCVSLYNISILKDIKSYFENKEYIETILFNNLVYYPEHLSINLLSETKIKSLISLDNKFDNIRLVSETVSPPLDILIKRFFDHTETMNKIRGTDIFDLQPQLREIFK